MRQTQERSSSREMAPWALLDYGFRAILAPSYADIFYNNCFKNGILPVVLPEPVMERIMRKAQEQTAIIVGRLARNQSGERAARARTAPKTRKPTSTEIARLRF